jgi:hypothetical protein
VMGDAVLNMPIPDPLPFFGANQAAFDCGGSQNFSVEKSLALPFRKVPGSPRFT